MIKSKLMLLLNTCNNDELKGFKKHLELKGNYLQKLFSFLLSKREFWDDEVVLSKEKVYRKIYGKKDLLLKKLSNLMSELALELNNFLIAIELERNSDLAIQLELRMYENRGLDKQFTRRVEQYLEHLEKQPQRDIAYHQKQFAVNYLAYNHPSFSKIDSKRDDLSSIQQYLDRFYYSLKTKLDFEAINRSTLVQENYEAKGARFLQEYMELNSLDSLPSVFVYKQLGDIYQTGNEDDFHQLVKDVKENLNSFNAEEQIDLLQSLINFCISLVHSGKKHYNEVILNLYKTGLERNIWVYKGVLMENVYMNIIVTACALKQIEWCRRFIEEYGKFLKKSESTSTQTLAKGYFHFKLGEFDEALKYLVITEYENAYHNMTARSFQLMCYFELENYELAIHDYMRSFNEYVRRNKLLGEAYIESVQNMIRFTRKLVQARVSKDYSELVFDKNKQYLNILWLETKVKELTSN